MEACPHQKVNGNRVEQRKSPDASGRAILIQFGGQRHVVRALIPEKRI